MTRILLALAIAGGFSVQAFAQSESETTCADFTAMDSEGQLQALESMSGEQSTSETAEGASSSDPQDATDRMATDEMTEQAVTACEEHPDMTVSEAMDAAEQN